MAGVPSVFAEAMRDRYVVERELGRGGMATVYLARDLKHHRQVAIKVLQPELAAAVGPERFLHEIQVTARLQHPSIVPLFDSDQADGFVFYVMPYIMGESLRDRLEREKQLSFETALEITEAVGSALDYAHRHDVIHRDIKPENILLHEGRALVADFGVALAVSAAGGGRLTRTGISLGTPSYMSPEQAAGEGTINGRADVYGLGCVLYEMLAGEAPYAGPTAQSLAAKHIGAAIPSIRTVRPDLSVEVDAAIRRALAKSPAGRFATAGEFAAALRAGSRHHGPPRHKWLAGVTAALLLAGLIWRALGLHSPAKPTIGLLPRLAVLPFRTLGDSSASGFADGLTEELTQRLGSLGGLRVIASGSARRAAELGLSAREAGESLGARYLLTGTVRQAGGLAGEVRLRVIPHLVRASDESEIWSQALDTSLAHAFDLQAAIAARVAQALELTISDAERQRLAGRPARDPRAYQLVLRALHSGLVTEEARTALREAVRLDSTYGLAAFALAKGAYLLQQSALEQAPKNASGDDVRRLLDRAIALDSNLYGAYVMKAHLAIESDWDLDAAQRQLDQLLRRNPSSADAHMLYAWVLERRRQHEEAIAAMREAITLDPLDGLLPVNLAWRFTFARQFDSAEATLHRTLRSHSDTTTFGLGPGEQRDAVPAAGHGPAGLTPHSLALWALGDALVAAGRAQEALVPYSRWSDGSGRSNVSLAYLAWAAAQAGQVRTAERLMSELARRRRDGYVAPVHLGIARMAVGDTAKARQEFRAAFADHSPLFGWLDGHPVFDALHRDPVIDSLLAGSGGWKRP